MGDFEAGYRPIGFRHCKRQDFVDADLGYLWDDYEEFGVPVDSFMCLDDLEYARLYGNLAKPMSLSTLDISVTLCMSEEEGVCADDEDMNNNLSRAFWEVNIATR